MAPQHSNQVPQANSPSPDFIQQVIQALQASNFSKTNTQNYWIIDSGASHHITGNLNAFDSSVLFDANRDTLPVKRVGYLKLNLPDFRSLNLSNALYVPTLYANLISVSQLVQLNYIVPFSSFGCLTYTNRKVIGNGHKKE